MNWKDTIDLLIRCKNAGLVRKRKELQRKWKMKYYNHNMYWKKKKIGRVICAICDLYSVDEQLSILIYSWIRPSAGESGQIYFIREYCALAFKHGMLLHEGDLRRMDFSVVFIEQLQDQHDWTQPTSMLIVFMCMHVYFINTFFYNLKLALMYLPQKWWGRGWLIQIINKTRQKHQLLVNTQVIMIYLC
jgi:hypothetical protein